MGLFRGLLGPVCLLLTWFFLLIQTSHQLQSSQTQVLMQLRKHLEYPAQLEIWKDHTVDFCYISFPGQVNITCVDNVVTELRISGSSGRRQTHRLSDQFSMDSFVTTLARLNYLRVLSLVNLGLWGPLPDKIGRLSALTAMDLSSNFLSGSVPPKISKMKNLQTLVLDHNLFNGSLPDWSDSLSHLTVLDLRNNRLSSQLPRFPKSLLVAFLSNNSLTGGIPNQYARITLLQQLDLSFNSLNGMPPAGVFALKNLSYLNLAHNGLSGSFTEHLACSSSLKFVDISNNKFDGKLPTCLGAKIHNRTVVYSWNCLSVESFDQYNVSYCEAAAAESKVHHHQGSHAATVVAIIAIIFTLVAFLACILLVICKKFCGRGGSERHLLHKTAGHEGSPAAFSTELIKTARFISDSAKLGTQVSPSCRSFSLDEVLVLTKNFDNSNFLGGGSNGKLYRGRLENGTQVAVRCMPLPKKYTIRNLKLRLDLLAKPRHPHLVCLLGHCIDSDLSADPNLSKVFLIYEYVPYGNFRTHLSEENPERVLNWFDRMTVLIGIAKAVHFLHTGVIPSFLNNRLKIHNILISEHRVAKLSDYGMSIISEEIEKPDNLKLLHPNVEDDVYNFGIIILETLVGPKTAAKREEIIQRGMAHFDSESGRHGMVDPVVLATCSQESLSVVVSLMNKCISPESANRPSFEDVLWNLQYAAQIQTPDGAQNILRL